ncbi:hypothetical protein TBLA_0C04240 [Henningerozyma blattae CBS 6284]|uniref:Homologous-pairing protein 2 winged helix domain-containing protein n=1 Tax=Henningerozyma blattae (strain ATCC 34711 / CBS 6284 / DSM 70876 / NBRC 10599 / NRRL Y-10934 / UCD 77-7) TaxID=1071380 RepID=I2H1H2_HENB6|nr:hypothetical protein TBLA_0C04240 [Tetrapisispora blattae CBS 6284]CCH60224.1 hypothetical protein TBLA_0C04240 [Tetrapisispora blattae CBS 6284]
MGGYFAWPGKNSSIKIERICSLSCKEYCNNEKNMPYSFNDLLQNLKNANKDDSNIAITKPALLKSLDALALNNEILSKPFGKVTIYCCVEQKPCQETSENVTWDAVNELKMELVNLDKDLNDWQKQMTALHKYPDNLTLLKEIFLLEQELLELQSMTKQLNNSTNFCSQQEVKCFMEMEKQIESELVKRKKLLKQIVLVLKDAVNPSNMNEFLVCIYDTILLSHMTFY